MKRCATNLGDQFGLSLYNNGSPAPVVQWSAAHPPRESDTATAPPLDQDPQVQPEPTPLTPTVAPEPSPAPAPVAAPAAQESRSADDRQVALDEMKAAAKAVNFESGLPAQFESTFGHSIEQGTAAEFREATALMRGTAAA
jgi:hypothetical protein